METKLTYVNLADAVRRFDVAIFQKNTEAPADPPVCWRLIEGCGRGWTHPFSYTWDLEIGVGTGDGSYSALLSARPGTRLVFEDRHGDRRLRVASGGTSVRSIEVTNNQDLGSIEVLVFRANKLVARKAALIPKQTTRFAFEPEIYLAAIDGPLLREGDSIDSDRFKPITRLRLFGLESGEIAALGGGAGPDATALTFKLTRTC